MIKNDGISFPQTSKENSLGKVLNTEFQGKIFRIKGFGPSILDRFEYQPTRTKGMVDYKLVFKSIFDHKRHSVVLSIDAGQSPDDLLPFVIKDYFQICESKDLTELDYLLFKREDTKKIDFSTLPTREDLDKSIQVMLNGTRMVQASDYLPAGSPVVINPRANGLIKNLADEGSILITSTPKGQDWMREYEAFFKDEPVKNEADCFKGLQGVLDAEDMPMVYPDFKKP